MGSATSFNTVGVGSDTNCNLEKIAVYSSLGRASKILLCICRPWTSLATGRTTALPRQVAEVRSMDGPFAKDLSDFARNCPRVEVWQKDASETPPLYRVIRSVERKYVSGSGAGFKSTQVFFRLTASPLWTQVVINGRTGFSFTDLAQSSELLGRPKTSVKRSMYARGPTERSNQSYDSSSPG